MNFVDEVPSRWGYPKHISHQFLPTHNTFDSLCFQIFYSNHPEEAFAIDDLILQKRLDLMVQLLISSSNLWLIIVFPFVMDMLFKYDVVYCIQTIYPLLSILKGPIMSLMAIETLLAGDLRLQIIEMLMKVCLLHCIVY